jgi:hypothetical protein
MEQRAAIKFYVKLNKTATLMIQMLKSVHSCMVKNAYLQQMCLNGSKSENAKTTGENNVDNGSAKDIIHHECVQEEQTLNSKFYKDLSKRLFLELIVSGLRFRKVDHGIICMTVHWLILWELSQSFWQNKGSPCYPICPTPLI